MKAAMLLLSSCIVATGCTSVVHKQNGTWDVPRQVETRSAFGTNQSAMLIENCKREIYRLVKANDYLDCEQVSPYYYASSPGAGGPIVSGALTGLGIGLGLSMMPKSTSTLNQHVDNGGVIYNKPVK